MPTPAVAEDAETDSIHVLIRRCAYRDAVIEAERVLGVELGRFCQAMLGETPEVQDAVRDVLLAFHAAMPSLETAPLRPWLFGTAYRACATRLAEQSPDVRADALRLARDTDGRLPPEGEATRRQARKTRAALADVGPKARAVCLLRFIGRLSYAQVATVCGISEQEAVKHGGRGLLALRDALDAPDGPNQGAGQ